jgi:SAM-dependent methyltransferase
MAELAEVRRFWQEHPLWTGESRFPEGTEAFFREHREVCIRDCFGGAFDPRFLPPPRPGGEDPGILDLGCGIGFWTVEFALRGFRNLVAADLTPRALELTRRRLEVYGFQAELREENAEALSFPDGRFDHVNCQGVVHHTPDPARAVAEIARVLKPGGTASLSVYYRNAALRLWPGLRWLGGIARRLGGGLRGRGREGIFGVRDAEELVRRYDGAGNPVGRSFSRAQFEALLRPHFRIDEIYYHFFPARALPLPVPRRLHRWLDRRLPFLIYANVSKPCAE